MAAEPILDASTAPSPRRSVFSRILSFIDLKLIILILIALHIFIISFPAKSFVFDEAHYIPAARDILKGVGSNPEHPFLGKAWIALGILLFGDNWFGWRIIPTVFSILTLIAFYYVSKKFLGGRLAVYSTALLGFENMTFIHGSLALLEVPSIFFALLSFWLYLERKGRKILQIPLYYWLSALAMSLSYLSKETAAFFTVTLIFLHISRTHYTSYRELLPKLWKGLLLLLLLGGVYLTAVTIYDQKYQPASSTQVVVLQTEVNLKDANGTVTSKTTVTNTTTKKAIIQNGIEHLLYTVSYASGLKITNESKDINTGNFAWNWILPIPSYPPLPYYIENAEVKQTTRQDGEVVSVTTETRHPIAWYGVGTLPIWWSIWFIAPYTIYKIVRKKGEDIDFFLLIWIGGTYLPMLYLSGVATRIVYPFYFIQTVPALAIGIPYLLNTVFKDRVIRNILLIVFMLIVLAIFVMYFPVRVNEF